MKAKEMFEELGFMQEIKAYGIDKFVIIYSSMLGCKYDISIGFNIKDKAVHTCTSFSLPPKIDVSAYSEIFKAIQKQLEELGWLE